MWRMSVVGSLALVVACSSTKDDDTTTSSPTTDLTTTPGPTPTAETGTTDTGTTEPGPVFHWGPSTGPEGAVEAFTKTASGEPWAVVDGELAHWSSGWTRMGRGDLPPGEIPLLMPLGDELIAWVNGKGTYRGLPSTGFTRVEGLFSTTLLLLNPDVEPVPLETTEGPGGTWMAAAGGLFHSADGLTWTAANLADTGNLNVLFTGVDTRDDTIVAVSMLPESIIPNDFQGLLSGLVFRSDDGGDSWFDATEGLPSLHPTSVALDDDGGLFVGTLDQGVLSWDGSAWVALGGPTDVVDVDAFDGGLSVASASRGAWRHDGAGWSQYGDAPILGMVDDMALDVNGQFLALDDGWGGEPPEDGGATVHIALSFHANYYHSYRGDEPVDDGFGLDIEVIRTVLDWLDEHPEVRADWDSDNYWTTDLWMPKHSPDILKRLAARVAAGTDDVRLMSWNNGAMASMDREEFAEAVQRGRASNEAHFGEMVPGVQPQENMLTPEHLTWYVEEGIEWITLFNAANGFTGIREDTPLNGELAFQPVTLRDSDGSGEMTMVPVYHHADVLDHGGLAGWARQLHAAYEGDVLLVVHFDADGESWENFDLEIEQTKPLDFVRWTKIADYLASHEPAGVVDFAGDIADGTGDGFQSWAEKDFNHRHFAAVQEARDTARAAAFLGAGVKGVDDALDDALTQRLLALSTTNYGLAAPFLHPDRYVAASAQVDAAQAAADEALARAEAAAPVAPGTIEVVQPRDSAGPALLTVPLVLPPGTWAGSELLDIRQDGVSLTLEAELVSAAISGDLVQAQVVVDVAAEATTMLTWSYGTAGATGPLGSSAAPELPGLEAPFTACGDGEVAGTLTASPTADVGERGTRASTDEDFRLPTCAATGSVHRRLSVWDRLPGVVVEVSAAVGKAEPAEDLESVVLTPFTCEGGLTTLRWRTFGGEARERPARAPVETWNGQSADGWAEAACATGRSWQLAHRVAERSSMGFLPVRNEGGDALLAPLGALWGDGPWHEGRQLGGHGIGDLVVPVVGSQFRPPAPDWSGVTVDYTLLVGEGLDDDVLDLFAHPPMVRVGSLL